MKAFRRLARTTTAKHWKELAAIGASVAITLCASVGVPATVAAWQTEAGFTASVSTGVTTLLGTTDGSTWTNAAALTIGSLDLAAGTTRTATVTVKNGGASAMRISGATLKLTGDVYAGTTPATVSIDDADLAGYQLMPGQSTQIMVTVTAPVGWPAAYLSKSSALTLSVIAHPSAVVCAPAGVDAGPPPDLTIPGKIVGAMETSLPQSTAVVNSVTAIFGKKINSANVFDNVGTTSYQSPINAIRTGASHVMTTLITLQPRNGSSAINDPAFSLATIIAGDHDAKLCQFAQDTATSARPTIVRFLHEMNGNWYPWAAGVNGNTPAQYVEAYRRVHDIFKQAGATNASIMWSPNGVSKLTNNVADFFPGNRYLDVAGPDVYNVDNHANAAALFGETVNQIRALTKAPIFFAETGAHTGTNRTAFISSLFEYTRANEDVIGFTYMQITKAADGASGDYELVSGTSAATAFQAGMAATTLKTFPVIPLP